MIEGLLTEVVDWLKSWSIENLKSVICQLNSCDIDLYNVVTEWKINSFRLDKLGWFQIQFNSLFVVIM